MFTIPDQEPILYEDAPFQSTDCDTLQSGLANPFGSIDYFCSAPDTSTFDCWFVASTDQGEVLVLEGNINFVDNERDVDKTVTYGTGRFAGATLFSLAALPLGQPGGCIVEIILTDD